MAGQMPKTRVLGCVTFKHKAKRRGIKTTEILTLCVSLSEARFLGFNNKSCPWPQSSPVPDKGFQLLFVPGLFCSLFR
jgi:hypothetical protein